MDPEVICEYSLSMEDVQSIISSSPYPVANFERYVQVWRGVFGWLDENQAQWLFNAAKSTNLSGHVVEIGTAFGRSTIALGLGTKVSGFGKVYGVDPHTGDIEIKRRMDGVEVKYSSLEGFKRNITRFELENWIEPIVDKSEDAVKKWDGKGIRLLFVDGWHTHEAVLHDIREWGKFVLPGGTIAAHDYTKVRDAIHEGMEALKGKELLHVDDNMVYFRKE